MTRNTISVPNNLEAMRAKRDRHLLARDAIERQIKPLQRKADDQESSASTIEEYIGQRLIQTWGENPDWQHVIRSGSEGGMTMYRYGMALLENLGLHFGMTWADTGDHVVSFGLNRYDDRERYRIEHSLRFIASKMRLRRGGVVWFNLSTHDSSSSSWTLILHVASGKATLWQQAHRRTVERIRFADLGKALLYVQENLWNDEEMPLEAAGSRAIGETKMIEGSVIHA